MTDLILVRHGETIWHHDNRYTGRSDVPLTERGHRQAEAFARWAATSPPHALWVSPLSRARDTAAPIAKATGLSMRIDERLVELDFGRGEGLTGAEMDAYVKKQVAVYRKLVGEFGLAVPAATATAK